MHTMIVDLQFGSTGKGLLAGYLSNKYRYDVCVTANMPNAGHTYISEASIKFVFKALPSGAASPWCRWALIGPGAVFDPIQLEAEVEQLQQHYGAMVGVHEMAWVLTKGHSQRERDECLDFNVGSTASGAMAAQVEKMSRYAPNDNRAGRVYQPSLKGIAVLSRQDYDAIIDGSSDLLIEGSQGYSLGLNAGFWPYCTSRDCTPTAFMAAMAIPPHIVPHVVGTMRTFPIRVGGNSGPWYPDQTEITWENLDVEPERTTVTNRIRRVATFSKQQIRDAVRACAPRSVFLNFCNYNAMNAAVIREWAASEGINIRYLGNGPTHHHVVEIL